MHQPPISSCKSRVCAQHGRVPPACSASATAGRYCCVLMKYESTRTWARCCKMRLQGLAAAGLCGVRVVVGCRMQRLRTYGLDWFAAGSRREQRGRQSCLQRSERHTTEASPRNRQSLAKVRGYRCLLSCARNRGAPALQCWRRHNRWITSVYSVMMAPGLGDHLSEVGR